MFTPPAPTPPPPPPQARVHEITLPLLLLHGRSDPTVPPAASRFAFHSVQSCDKTLEVSLLSYIA